MKKNFNCSECKKDFLRYECFYAKRQSVNFFCSKKCKYKFQIGKFTHFQTEETKIKIRNSQINEKSHNWRGEKAGYAARHGWIKRHYGFAKQHACEFCGRKIGEVKRMEWANLDRKYSRNRETWATLCTRCHHEFDRSACSVFHLL